MGWTDKTLQAAAEQSILYLADALKWRKDASYRRMYLQSSVSMPTIQKAMRGEEVRMDAILRLSIYYDVCLDRLFGFSDQCPDDGACMDPVPEQLGRISLGLRRCRKESPYTMEEIAELLRTDPRQVYHWEEGYCLPTTGGVAKLMILYGTTFGEVMG